MPVKKYHHGDLKNALIQAGVEVLSREGVGGLSLRKVAARAGVSHAAPYAHFADRQALVAAISAEGFHRLYERIDRAARENDHDPALRLARSAWAYVAFALDDPAHFKVMFSNVVEQQQAYPDFVATVQKNFQQLVTLVEQSQQAGLLSPGPAETLAVSVWSLVHGFTLLYLENQISHTILEGSSLQELLLQTLNQVTRRELPAGSI
jgi:AcrR family transcriptional regulator